jgi:hypothetical protein
MEQLARSELKLLLEGLDALRGRMREDVTIDLFGEEYRTVVRLQERIIRTLENLPY